MKQHFVSLNVVVEDYTNSMTEDEIRLQALDQVVNYFQSGKTNGIIFEIIDQTESGTYPEPSEN